MGNLSSCMKRSKKEQLLGNQCPHCKFWFSSVQEKQNHMKNCVYNKGSNSEQEFVIYADPYKL